MRAKMVSKDVDVGENGANVWVVLEYSLTRSRTKLQKKMFMN
jgi:hypothetical protein